MRTRRRQRSAPSLGLLVAALGLLAAACSGGSNDTPQETAQAAANPKAALQLPAPLTGLLVGGEVASHPAVTVKVDNSPQGRPQSGLDRADVVIEEKVEGTITRLLAVFQSQDAARVGPVRSLRSTDVALVSPIGGVFAFAGGIPEFESLIRRAPVVVISETTDGDAFDLRGGRPRPYKTYTSTARLRRRAGAKAKGATRLFDFLGPGEAFGPPGAVPAAGATVVFGPRTTAGWDYDAASGQWRRTTNGTPHLVEGGVQLAFTNVIMQHTRYGTTVYRDRSGAPVDEAVVIGGGEAIILSRGRQVRARWSKASLEAPIRYTQPDGAPVKLAPGRTWVALPPEGASVTTR
jgi:hypothetical protein